MQRTLSILLLCVLAIGTMAQDPQPVSLHRTDLPKPALCLTPPMGWSSWNTFGCNVDETLIRQIADQLVESGLSECGYIYLNIDDCWHGERDADGFIQADPERFPHGIRALADYAHERGLKLGLYSDAGSETCGGRPGSQGHEYQDAIQYARWGVDYLKYDWCNTDNINARGAYALMAKALRMTDRDIVFSLCEWGDTQAYSWASEIGHLWRTTGDVNCCFDCELDFGGWKSLGVLRILDKNEPLRRYAGPGHWNDPDMLEVGNGMSVGEDRAHFTMWCMMAAPLILGNDIRSMSRETRDIITNREMIAVDQDSLGIQGLRYRVEAGLEYWVKPLKGGDWAVTILNRSTTDRTIQLDWRALHLRDDLTGRTLETATHSYGVRNLWSHRDEADTRTARRVAIPAHDVVSYRLIY